MEFRIGQMNFKAEKAVDEKCLAISAVLSRGWKDVFLFLYFVDVEIGIHARDWMLPGEDEVIGGRTYKTFSRNPKYMNDKVFTFMFPKSNRPRSNQRRFRCRMKRLVAALSLRKYHRLLGCDDGGNALRVKVLY
jgi:hypothetical protein